MAELVRGSVTDRPWGRTFAAFGLRGVTGQLTLVSDGKRFLVAFESGAVVAASSPLASDAAVRVALTSHLVSSSQVPEVTRRQAAAPERDEIELIAELARLGPDHALRLRRRVIAQRAARTFSINHGEFVVTDRTELPILPGCELDIRAVIYMGARTNLSEQRLSAELDQLGSWFRLKPGVDDDLPQFGFTDLEQPVIERLRNGGTISQIEEVATSFVDGRTVHAVVYSLAVCGACELGPPNPPSVQPRGMSSTLPPRSSALATGGASRPAPGPQPGVTAAPAGPQSPRATLPTPPVGVPSTARPPTNPSPPRALTPVPSAQLATAAPPVESPSAGQPGRSGQSPARPGTGPNPTVSPAALLARGAPGPLPTRPNPTAPGHPMVAPGVLAAGSAVFAPISEGFAEAERGPEHRARPEAPDPRSEESTGFGQWRGSDTPAAKRTETREAGQDEPNDREAFDVRGGHMKSGVLDAPTQHAGSNPAMLRALEEGAPHDGSSPGLRLTLEEGTPRDGSSPGLRLAPDGAVEPTMEPVILRVPAARPPRSPLRSPLRSPPRSRQTRPTDAPQSHDVKALIVQRLKLLDQGADHFQLLGVAQDVAQDALRKAYFALARQLHPDRLAALGIPDDGKHAQRLFAQINAGFTTLSDPERRARYLDVVRRGGEAAVRAEQARTEELARRILDAEEAFRRGELALRRDQPQVAVAEFELAIQMNPDEADYHALFAWSQFCAAPDKTAVAAKTRSLLDRAIQRSPRSVTARFYLGRVERMLGRDPEALRLFREVLVAAPGHAEAAAELRLIEARIAGGDRPGGGLFGRSKR